MDSTKAGPREKQPNPLATKARFLLATVAAAAACAGRINSASSRAAAVENDALSCQPAAMTWLL